MFAELSPVWRRRLVAIVAVWAVVLVAAAFGGRRATVHEQADADEGRRAADAAVGVAASALSGSAFEFAVGPGFGQRCAITPVREGVEYVRTFEVYTDEPELAFRQAAADLADHLGVEGPDSAAHWRRTAKGSFLTVGLHVESGAEGPSLVGSVSTGCRPSGADFGAISPSERPGWIDLAAAHPGLDAADAVLTAYARIDCAEGGAAETWWWSASDDRRIPLITASCE